MTKTYTAGPLINTDLYAGFSKEASRCVIEAALDIGLYQGAIPSVLAVKGAVADRIHRPPSGAIAVTAL